MADERDLSGASIVFFEAPTGIGRAAMLDIARRGHGRGRRGCGPVGGRR